jgi:hypothetical protein
MRKIIIFCQYATIKSEKDFNTEVTQGNSVTDPLNVSKIQGNTNPKRYITATTEITIKIAGYVKAPIYFCLMSLK